MSDKNKLAEEKSPYLQQHTDNPVDWYPWGDEAFEKARREDKPIFLSIGYATCHWCHVMAHESFEDDEVAELMNETFVNIKVDREERPDIDNTYMTVCQMLTGSGGWPLTILMTPEKKPFYAATYIPKEGRRGRPGMMDLIPRIDEVWNNNREKVYGSADEISAAFEKSTRPEAGEGLNEGIFEKAFSRYAANYDSTHGGIGGPPKFPSPHNLMFLLRHWHSTGDEKALGMVTNTLTHMRRGGIYDHVGNGFHRYSTDARWLLPHFEKMLYDQAMHILCYTEAWQATGNDLFRQTAEETAKYLMRDMRDDEGAFYSAEDADTEGEEGKFYVWEIEEVRKVLPAADAELAIEVFNMDEKGNYADEASGERTGKNILHLKKSREELASERDMTVDTLEQKLEHIRQQLLDRRQERVRPLRDEKVLTDWNALTVSALARAGNAFDNEKLRKTAEQALEFILNNLQKENGTLLHRYKDGEAAIDGHADDYAFLISALLDMYEVSFNNRYLKQAFRLNEIFVEQFWDEEEGGFFFTSESAEELLGRTREVYDGAMPSGNSIALLNLLRLARISADTGLDKKADRMITLFSSQVEQAPTGFGQFLQGVHFALRESCEIVIAGSRDDSGTRNFLETLRQQFVPNKILLLKQPGDEEIHELAPFTRDQNPVDGKAAAYVCKNHACKRPVTDPDKMIDLLP